MQATMIAGGLLGLLLLVLSIRVTLIRRADGISMGDGGNVQLMMRRGAQSNCVEYVPVGLFLLFLAEQAYGTSWFVVALAAMLVIGRILHPFGMTSLAPNLFRVAGMVATWTSLGLLAFLVLWAGLLR